MGRNTARLPVSAGKEEGGKAGKKGKKRIRDGRCWPLAADDGGYF